MRNLINYIVCLAVALALSIYISGTGGIFILTVMLCALAVSSLIVYVTYKNLHIDLTLSNVIANKGETVKAYVELKKSTVIPSAFVEIKLSVTPNISSQRPMLFKVVTAQLNGERITVPVKTQLCGMGEVRIDSIFIVDYLGIIRIKLFKRDEMPESSLYCREIKIMPEIPDTGMQAEVIRATSDNADIDDNDDDNESEEAAIGSTGVAGYDHRQYEIGDPLKRVNWKMSSKRGILMVRLDDKILTSTQSFLLDYPERSNPDRIYYYNADQIIEASLAMLSMLLMQGYESEYSYYLDGWQTVVIKDEKSLIELQEALSAIKPCKAENRIAPEEYAGKKGIICFTACMGDMNGLLNVFDSGKNVSVVVTKNSGIGKICDNVWTVDDNFEFSKL